MTGSGTARGKRYQISSHVHKGGRFKDRNRRIFLFISVKQCSSTSQPKHHIFLLLQTCTINPSLFNVNHPDLYVGLESSSGFQLECSGA